ncbi:Prenyltransferase and squalene oxidase repeat-containing protein [Streptomyces sp. 2323.1]|uniref:prenyltransferase/squalene oxidase repeat-containing protein n=1 Tax=Streptomyces sp. 2323.1 TaxID=1938841 RepID=UPI000BB850BD|nr:prenyltransferase/squalene oxidase repeat-containing protein [Streptomyces sp. 2323.1]SOE14033.1 Prenyltransferase and squalene oxidase repeat-containing protein [Streptomyces sp. 2323.1]
MAPTASLAQQAPAPHSGAPLARRAATALAAALVLGAAAAPAAYAAVPGSPSAAAKKLPAGLYGTKDPQYDGVWRQSLALLAQHTVGVRPAASGVRWLVGQQCADGAFTAFRAEPGKPCAAKAMRDTNQTAAAVQALAALGGHGDAVDKAVGWLKSVQNDDGSWSSMPGSPGDANSTSVVIGALAAAGQKPASVTSKKHRTPYDGLLTFRLSCAGKEEAHGAFTFQLKGAAPNADATAAAATGVLGKGFVVAPAGPRAHAPVTPPACKDGKDGKDKKAGKVSAAQAADGGAAYLVAQLDKNGQHLLSAMPGAKPQPDVGNTADAVVALAAGGHGAEARRPLAWLQKNAANWARQSGPAAYAQLVLAAHATGSDPRAFGGTDLVTALNATGPEPAAVSGAHVQDAKDDDGGIPWWIIGVGLAFGAGLGFLLSGRKRDGR